jgi:phospho-N-acetylmuramoyl-pentapeptide-transferase
VGLGDFIGSYFIITAVSNGANLTDGIDGLAGTSAISVLALGFYVRLRKYYFL